MGKRFDMPPIHKGQTVLWYDQGNRNIDPLIALVTSVGFGTLALNVTDSSLHNFMHRDGVRHIDDPDAARPGTLDAGAWDYTDWDKKLLRVVEAMEQLSGPLTLDKVAAVALG